MEDEELYQILIKDNIHTSIETLVKSQNLDSIVNNYPLNIAKSIVKQGNKKIVAITFLMYQFPDPDSEIVKILSSKKDLIEEVDYVGSWKNLAEIRNTKRVGYIVDNRKEVSRRPNLSDELVFADYSSFPRGYIGLKIEADNTVGIMSPDEDLFNLTPKSNIIKISYMKDGKCIEKFDN